MPANPEARNPAGKSIYLGTDSGATTSKTGGVREDGTPVSMNLRQSSTNAQAGREAVITGWVEGLAGFLLEHGFTWDQVGGIGLALPGPYLGYGILDRSPNLPASFEGWNFLEDYRAAIRAAAGREIPVVTGNDGNYGGVGEAARVRGNSKATILMLAPGSGLGAAYVGPDGLPLEGDTLAGTECGHMPLPLHMLSEPMPVLRCGCGRTWGCVEPYTTISGLPQLMELKLGSYPDHPLGTSSATPKEKALSLRGLAQNGDAFALEIFDFQARALGLHVANLTMAFDAGIVVIGGGLLDPEATTEAFRERYLRIIRESAAPWLYSAQRGTLKIVPATLGDLSQAIGAALTALYTARKRA